MILLFNLIGIIVLLLQYCYNLLVKTTFDFV